MKKLRQRAEDLRECKLRGMKPMQAYPRHIRHQVCNDKTFKDISSSIRSYTYSQHLASVWIETHYRDV